MTARRVASQTSKSPALSRAASASKGRRHVPARTITLTDSCVVPHTDEFGTWDLGADGRVTQWVTAKDTAEWLGITTRRLRQLERLGMPARGFRGSCRYPWPHAGVWWCMWKVERAHGHCVAHLDIEDAFEEYDKMNAVAEIEFEYRMRRDPELRASFEKLLEEDAAIDREDARRIRRRTAKTTQQTQRTPSSPES